MKKNLLFVINPIAGGREKGHIHRVVDREIDRSLFDYEFAYTESVDHARKLSKSAAYLGFDVVAAVGGDGTVNEVARGVLDRKQEHQAVMAIVPFGSGNGLARHLRIPMRLAPALRLINTLKTTSIDTALMNGRPFFCAAGVGFDAHISLIFAEDSKRGFLGYAKAALREIRAYRPVEYLVAVDGVSLREKAFLVTLANSAQYGNNAYIAPGASTCDGLLDICVLKPFPAFRFPEMAFRLMSGSINGSSYMHRLQGKKITIERGQDGPVHVDGEPEMMGKLLDIRVMPSSLEVLVP